MENKHVEITTKKVGDFKFTFINPNSLEVTVKRIAEIYAENYLKAIKKNKEISL